MKKITLTLFLICLSFVSKAQLVNVQLIDSISIYFESGSSKISNQNELINRLNAIENIQKGKIELKAYTDTIGSITSNKKLASNRISEASSLIKKSKLKNLKLASFNLNEIQNSTNLSDKEKRRVDILVYSTTSNFKLKIPIVLNIEFQGDKADLIGEDNNEDLAELIRIMKSDPTITIKLNGHVAVRPDQALSEQRAIRIKNYLLKEGIEEKRMTCQGFSNSQPLVPPTSEENHAINRRVEVIFFKK